MLPVLETAQQDVRVLALQKQAQEIEQQARTMTVTADTLDDAANALASIARLKKGIEERRVSWVKPLNDTVKKVNDWFKSVAAPLESADKLLRGKIQTYQAEEARRRREEEERLRKLAEKEHAKQVAKAERKGEEPPPPPPTVVVPGPATTIRSSAGTVSTTKVWDFEIVDESQIPREFLMVDTTKIRKVVQAGLRNIPGVRIYERDQLRVAGR